MKGLIVGGGGLRGAYSGGVIQRFMEVGPSSNYFDKFYACSVGVYPLVLMLSGQTEINEAMWRHHVGGLGKLINPFNIFRRRPFLDLPYLLNVFRDFGFNADAVATIGERLTVVVTDIATSKPGYLFPSSGEEVFQLMAATSAVPRAHPPINISGAWKTDGGLSDPIPIKRALEDGCSEVVVVLNNPRIGNRGNDFLEKILEKFPPLIFRKSKIPLKDMLQIGKRMEEKAEALMDNNPKIVVIRPSCNLPFSSLLDSSPKKINDAFDLGYEDGRLYTEDGLI